MSRHVPRALTALAAVALVAAACGGSTDEAQQAAPTTAAATEGGDGTQAATDCPSGAPLPEDTNLHGAVAAQSGAVTLEADDQFFAPTCVTGVSGETLTVTVTNVGQALHNIQLESQGIDEDVAAGESVTVEVEVGAEPLEFTCKYHTTLGMHGAIIPADA